MDKQERKNSLWKTTQEFYLLCCRLCKDFMMLRSVILTHGYREEYTQSILQRTCGFMQ